VSLVDHITPTTTKTNASYPLMQMYFRQLQSILVQDDFVKSHTAISIAIYFCQQNMHYAKHFHSL